MLNNQNKKILIKALLLGVLLAASIYISVSGMAGEFIETQVASYGYLGIFLVSILSGFNIAVPIPIITFLPAFLSVGLSFWATVLVISVGMTLGDVVGYLIGNTGRSLVDVRKKENRIINYLEKYKKKHKKLPYVILFFYAAFAPAPNELIVIPLSFMGYRILPMALLLTSGNIIFNVLVGLGVLELVSLF